MTMIFSDRILDAKKYINNFLLCVTFNDKLLETFGPQDYHLLPFIL